MRGTGISPYERDNITELGDVLFVMPHMTRSFGQRLIRRKKTNFEDLLSELDYEKQVLRSSRTFYDGGRFIVGENFGLVSTATTLTTTQRKSIGLLVPTYDISQVSTIFLPGIYHDYGDGNVKVDLDTNGHIDCRYNLVDSARLIYVAMGARPGTMEEGHNPLKEDSFKMLERAAKEHGYEIRDFVFEQGELEARVQFPEFKAALGKFGEKLVIGAITNGINFITNGNVLFTSIIGEREKEYLKSKGVRVVEVPMKFSYNGAGLRCLYGELTVQSK